MAPLEDVQVMLRRQRDALRKLRAESGLTQQEVARAIPMEYETYRTYERGSTELRLGQFGAFARALRTSVDRLSYELGLAITDEDRRFGVECQRLMRELSGESPEFKATALEWFRDSVQVLKRTAAAARN